MPALVRNKEEEEAWKQASLIAKKAGEHKNYAYVVEVYKRILKRPKKKPSKPRQITYEMDAKERKAIRDEAKNWKLTVDKSKDD